jgi:putative redox protein
VEVELQFKPGGVPAAGTDIGRRISLSGQHDKTQRRRLLRIADACPLHKVLTGEVRIASGLVG